VQELEIARGVVYVVAWNTNSEPAEGFHVWSSPADHLHWTKDPLVLPLGAGPVPEQQLVFAGGDGWLLDSDRDLLGGARVSGTRRWTSWTPPCRGFATLAASSRTDVVVLCDENGFAGPGPPKPVLYSSHDGGVTFHQHRAPALRHRQRPNAHHGRHRDRTGPVAYHQRRRNMEDRHRLR
jgi:hypothetical protein